MLFDAIRKIADNGTAALIVDESTTHALATADYCYFLDGGYIVLRGQAADFEARRCWPRRIPVDEAP